MVVRRARRREVGHQAGGRLQLRGHVVEEGGAGGGVGGGDRGRGHGGCAPSGGRAVGRSGVGEGRGGRSVNGRGYGSGRLRGRRDHIFKGLLLGGGSLLAVGQEQLLQLLLLLQEKQLLLNGGRVGRARHSVGEDGDGRALHGRGRRGRHLLGVGVAGGAQVGVVWVREVGICGCGVGGLTTEQSSSLGLCFEVSSMDFHAGLERKREKKNKVDDMMTDERMMNKK